jgi:aminoglycoside phosphotransferase (APT) family kinase protein
MAAVAQRLHVNEVTIDDALVRKLLAEQFPDWADLSIKRVLIPGSDHVLFRLGDELVARLPRKAGVDQQVEKERTWLPRLAPHLPTAVPASLAKGMPSADYPFSWSVCRWLDGTTPSNGIDEREIALDLARLVMALQAIDAEGGPQHGEQNFGRGEPLAQRDARTRKAIAQLDGVVDAEGVTAAWDDALAAPAWQGRPVWLHGDLTPENVLVRDGRLTAVIDFGCLGVGDPACDLMVAWSLLTGAASEAFRVEVGPDEATWRRARGWALSTALVALPYYAETHPPRAANARYRIAQVLADLGGT